MELKQGYKQTEVGVLPKEWAIKKLKEVSYVKGRIGWQGLNQTEFTDNPEEPFLITGMNFKDGSIRWNEAYHISEERFNIAKEIQLRPYDVLMTKDGTIGKLLYVETLPYPYKATLNSHLLLFRPLKSVYHPKYLYYNLASPFFNKHIEITKSGTTFFGVSQESVGEYNLVLPPLHEQTAIANALSDMDALISQTEKLIDKKKAIKQGAMQELLKPKEGWETKKLGDVISFQTGFPFSSHNFSKEPNGIRLIKNRDLRSDDSIIYFCDHYIEDFLVNNGDLLIGMDGDFEPVIWHKGIALLNQRVGRVKKKKEVSLGFLAYTLLAELKLIESRTGSTTVKHLSHSDVENIELRMPDYKDQCKIDTVLRDLTNEIDHLSRKLNKFKFQKQGMMQALLIGKIRLI